MGEGCRKAIYAACPPPQFKVIQFIMGEGDHDKTVVVQWRQINIFILISKGVRANRMENTSMSTNKEVELYTGDPKRGVGCLI